MNLCQQTRLGPAPEAAAQGRTAGLIRGGRQAAPGRALAQKAPQCRYDPDGLARRVARPRAWLLVAGLDDRGVHLDVFAQQEIDRLFADLLIGVTRFFRDPEAFEAVAERIDGSSVTRVFVRQKIRSVAILKCVGATTAQILSTYLAQVILLGLTGSLLGVGIAWIAIASIPASLAASFGGVPYGLTLSAVLQGLFVGLIVSVLFALAPLLEIRRVKPLLLLRGLDAQIPRERVDWIQIGVMMVVSAALVSVAVAASKI